MNTQIYESLHNVSWYCCQCGLPNFSSGLFTNSDSTLDSFSNPFECLNSIPENNSVHDLATPKKFPPNISASTPNPEPKSKSKTKHHSHNSELTTLVVNFQSFWPKRFEFSSLCYESKADIIISTETWLSPEIENSELLLNDYDIFRKDHKTDTTGGRVM